MLRVGGRSLLARSLLGANSVAAVSPWSRACSAGAAHVWPIERLNRTLEEYPLSASALHLTTSMGTFGLAYMALASIHFDAPALAVAGIVSRLTKKFRTPVDLSLAAVLAHAVPWTNTLKLGPLLGVMKGTPDASSELALGARSKAEVNHVDRLEARVARLASWAEGPINQYGGPYMMVHWASGLTLVGATTYCVDHGLDVMSVLSQLPFVSTAADGTAAFLSEKASCVAGGMVRARAMLLSHNTPTCMCFPQDAPYRNCLYAMHAPCAK